MYSTSAEEIFNQLSAVYPSVEFDHVAEVLVVNSFQDPTNKQHIHYGEVLSTLKPDSVLSPGAKVVIVPKYWELRFSFRSLGQHNSLRALSKIIVGTNAETPIAGCSRRINGTEIEVVLRSYFQNNLEEIYNRFSTQPILMPNGVRVR